MSGNVHSNPVPIFPCFVCTENVTWRGKSVQCCTCSKWVHLRCSQLSSLILELLAALTLGAAPPPCRNTVTPSSDSSDSLRVLQWNAGGLRARRTKLLHFLSSHPVDLICIQESNLYSFSSFRISGFSALRSNRTHSRSGILSLDDTPASGGVVIFVRQGLSFSELSTSSLSSLDPYSDYVGVNISLNNSSLLSFLNVYAPPPYSLLPNGWQNQLLFFLCSSLLQKSLHSGGLQLPSPPLRLKRYFLPPQRGSIQLGHLL